MLGVSMATVLRRFKRGQLPGFRLFGEERGPLRFRVSEVEALLETWRNVPRD